MKKLIVGALVAGAVLAAPNVASATMSPSNWCRHDGYRSVTGLRAGTHTPRLSCTGAYRVLDRWMNNDGLEGTVRIRVGRQGWLWKCEGYREPNQLRRWNVACYSAKRVWINRYGGYSLPRSMWFTYWD
jgi:hypothetical protein